jgi:hypothetical protein
MKVAGHVARVERMKNTHKIESENRRGEETNWETRPRLRWEDIEIDLRGKWCKGMDWIQMTQGPKASFYERCIQVWLT